MKLPNYRITEYQGFSLTVGLAALFVLCVWTLGLGAEKILQGPIPADVISVYDGDTFTVRAHIWPGITAETSVRVDGVDTPEMRGKCPKERVLAALARDFVKRVVGARVQLRDVRPGKYAGRVVARVFTLDGEDLAELVIANALGRPYSGGKRKGWCD